MTKTRKRNLTAEERRIRREREFAADVVEYLEGLDRRRAAEARLQPLSDFLEVA